MDRRKERIGATGSGSNAQFEVRERMKGENGASLISNYLTIRTMRRLSGFIAAHSAVNNLHLTEGKKRSWLALIWQ
jgi:hypothetical protein